MLSDIRAVSDALYHPAFVVTASGSVVHANKLARELGRYPDWLGEAEVPSEEARCVALCVGGRDYRVVLLPPTGLAFLDETSLQERYELPPRLARVALGITRGLSDKEIAKQLTLGFHTVRSYSKELYRRLGVHSRTELINILAR